jgi:hypothetical protein
MLSNMSDITTQLETKRRQVREIDAKLREMPSGTKKRGEAYNTKLMLQMEIDELERVIDSQEGMGADDSPSGAGARMTE